MRSLVLFCVLWLLAPLLRAHAQAGEPPDYRPLIDDALAEYEANHLAEARALFARAQVLYPNARALRGLGMVEFELRNYSASVEYLEQALAAKVQQLDGPLRAETERLLARARGFIGRLNLALEPGAALVIVDGTPVELGPRRNLVLEVGDHVLEFRADGFSPERRVLKVQGGDEQTLRVVLPASERARPVAPGPAQAESAPSRDGAEEDAAPRRRLFHVVPRLTLLMPMPGRNTTEDHCNASGCPPRSTVDYRRNVGVMLGVDLMLALSEELQLGLGLAVQLNSTRGSSDEANAGVDYGRTFWIPVSLEYRLAISKRLYIPLRALLGLALLKPSSDLKAVGRDLRTRCEDITDQGGDCTVQGPPAIGMVAGVGPSLVFQLRKVALRADLTFGYQWLRLFAVEARWNDGFQRSHKESDGSYVMALSLGVEI